MLVHVTHTTGVVVAVADKSGCTYLDLFKLVDVSVCVWVPCRSSILNKRAIQGKVSQCL